MDCQSTEATLETPGVEDALKSVDVFIPNEMEAIQLTGASSAKAALIILAKLTPLVIIKCGGSNRTKKSPLKTFCTECYSYFTHM